MGAAEISLEKNRYPYGSRTLTANLLSVFMGSLIVWISSLAIAEALTLWLLSLVIVTLGASPYLLIQERGFSSYEELLANSPHRVVLRRTTQPRSRRDVLRDLALLFVAIAVPILLAYVLDPLLWIVLITSFFLAMVTGRLGFLLRLRLWERSNKLRLFAFTSETEDAEGSVSFESGILAESIVPPS